MQALSKASSSKDKRQKLARENTHMHTHTDVCAHRVHLFIPRLRTNIYICKRHAKSIAGTRSSCHANVCKNCACIQLHLQLSLYFDGATGIWDLPGSSTHFICKFTTSSENYSNYLQKVRTQLKSMQAEVDVNKMASPLRKTYL